MVILYRCLILICVLPLLGVGAGELFSGEPIVGGILIGAALMLFDVFSGGGE